MIEEMCLCVNENVKSKKFLKQHIHKIWDAMKRTTFVIIGIEEGEETQFKGAENIFNQTIEEKLSNLKERPISA